MSVTIPLWAIPIALSLALWAGVILWPLESRGGDYNFGQAFEALGHCILGIIGTLLIRLVYFATMFEVS